MMLPVSDQEEKLSSQDTKFNKRHHPMKLIAIFLFWILTLYLALILLKNFEIQSPESSRPSVSKSVTICKSPECINLAHQLHNWQDISADPCQDFFKATCGKYNEDTVIEGTRYHKMNSIIQNLVKEYLIKNQPTTSKSENIMKVYYQKCEEEKDLNKARARENGLKEIFERAKSIGSAPMIDENWNEANFDLNDMMSKMAALGKTNFGFFGISQSGDSKLDISLEKSVAQEILFAQEFGSSTYEKFWEFFSKVNNIQKEDIEETMQFNEWKALLRSNFKTLHYREVVGFSELQEYVPSVDFQRIIKKMLNPNKKESLWNNIFDKIKAGKDSYFFSDTNNLETILRTTSKRTLANFLVQNFLLSEAFQFAFHEKHTDCAKKTILTFPLASLRIFVRNHYDKINLDAAAKMVDDIHESFIEVIQNSKWLHEETKLSGIRKIKMMKKIMGYPKELEVSGSLDSFFETLNLYPNETLYDFGNKVEKFKAELAIDFIAAQLPIESNNLYFSTNAFYEQYWNQLNLNVPFLNSPIFDSTYPSYAKLASIGGVIGHETGHGFDPIGIKYDEVGKMTNSWRREDLEEYDRRAQCLIDQYNNYDDPDFGRNLNGSRTLGEMIADNIGLNVAWRTYKKIDISKEPRIIGFEDYNPDKLFFRMAALNRCRGRDNTPLATQLKKVHPTSSFRVNGVFSNMKSFAEAYNCPVGSPMNPEKKCEML